MRTLLISIAWVALLGLRLSAIETSVPLGIVYANQDAFFDLVYQNESPDPLQIRHIAADCDCITVLTHPATVAAGASARIPCVYRSATAGSIQISIEVFGADPARPQTRFKVTGFVAEKSWLSSAREILAAPQDEALLVDVRSPDEFLRAHLPRAINLPVFSLKTRAALRSRKLVLVDDGAVPDTLLAEVLTLRARGFKDVTVLAGGLPAWVRAGGAVEGEEKSAIQLSAIQAARFGRSNVSNAWRCIAFGAPLEIMKHSIPIQHAASIEDLDKLLSEMVWPVSGGATFHPVLMVLADDQSQAPIESRFGKSQQQQLYYLNGGMAALEAFQTGQAALAHHTGQTVTIRPVASRPTVAGRCGSCGSK